jgi:signal transduction histidine kinase
VNDAPTRVLVLPAGRLTVVVYTDLSRVDDSVRVLTRAALIGAPLAVALLGALTYIVVRLTLRPVAALRDGAAKISRSTSGPPALAGQRLPVPAARDEIQRLALTLNAMLDRIESGTAKQRTFVGDAAHELRSPLASLRVQLEVAQRLGPDTDWQAVIDDVLLDVERLNRLVEDLLRLARIDERGVALRPQPVCVADLAETVVARYGHARVPVTLGPHTTDSESRAARVLGDPDGLRRVITNLVDNAVRYAASGVEVDVELTRPARQAAQRRAGARVVLTVTDDGPGLPEHERELVFDRFYRAEFSRSRDSGGTGLGLPIVRELVRAHRGSVRLHGRPDGNTGLRAVVDLPLAEVPAPEGPAAEAADSEGAGRRSPAERLTIGE